MRYGRLIRPLLLVVPLLFFPTASSFAKTTVTKGPGECTVTVTISIAVHGPNAFQELADRWKRNIESSWNNPTHELAMRVARDNNLDPEKSEDRIRINELAKDYLKENGVPTNCSYVNCCNICFKADVKLITDVLSDPDHEKKYHIIRAVPNYTTEIKDGKEVRNWNRSYVMGLNGQNASTTGQWRDDATDFPPEAHEVGHLMGLDDEYHDDADGNSVTHEGHDNDLMANNLGWPWEDGIRSILEIGNVDCNCCNTMTDRYYQRYGIAWRPANDAIITCNIDLLRQTLNDLQDQRSSLQGKNVPITLRYDIDNLIKKIEKAIEDCGPKVSYDSSEWCTYWGGGTTIPPSGPPVTVPPGGPPGTKPPDTSPPEQPVTPGLRPPVVVPPSVPPEKPPTTTKEPPGETPGQPPTTAPPVVIVKAKQSVLDSSGQQKSTALPGAMIKLSSTKPPALPMAGAKKDDNGYSDPPVQGVTGPDGTVVLTSPEAVPGGKTGLDINKMPMLAMSTSGSSAENLFAEALREGRNASDALRKYPNTKPLELEITIPSFKSYIVKVHVNRKLERWDDPVSYLANKQLAAYIMRKWIVGDVMYVVLNIPQKEEQGK